MLEINGLFEDFQWVSHLRDLFQMLLKPEETLVFHHDVPPPLRAVSHVNSSNQKGFVAQIAFTEDSLSGSSMIAACHEQLEPDDVQDAELGAVQSIPEATWIVIDLV